MNELLLQHEVINYLNDNYFFRNIGMRRLMGWDGSIYWTRKNNRNSADQIDSCNQPLEILDKDLLENWHVYDKKWLVFFADEFILQGYGRYNSKQKTAIKGYINEYVTSAFTEIQFPEIISTIIEGGRTKVSGVAPIKDLRKREEIKVQPGDSAFVCKKTSSPFVVNPCYVLSVTANGAKVIFFDNVDREAIPTNKLLINSYSFHNFLLCEIGSTPQQAVQNCYF